jgi:hypothetical protein
MRRIGREWREDKVFRDRESANGTKSSRSIILDFWQVGVGSKPEELAPQTSHRARHQEEPCG